MNPSSKFAFPTNGYSNGLTKREWFAGMALQGMLSASHEQLRDEVYQNSDKAATWAYQYADAMLKEENSGDNSNA